MRGPRRSGSGRLVTAGAALLTCAPFLAVLPFALAGASSRPTSMVAITAAPRIPLGDGALGPVVASSTESGIVVLQPSDEAALTSFIAAVTDKSSPLFHQYLAPGQFAQRFGPTRATVAAVRGQLTAEGLRVTSVSRDGLLVSFSGSAATVETAFGTKIERYRLADGTIGQATTSAVRVPSTIAGSVASVVGLDDLVHVRPAYVRPGPVSVQRSFPTAKATTFPHTAGSPTPCASAQEEAETSGGLTDDQIANAYGAFGLYRSGDFGKGQHVAVYELQPFLATDIEAFDTCYFGATEAALMSGKNGKLTGSLLSVIPVDGGELQPGSGSENDESTLDIEDVSAIAPEANIDVYEAPNTTFGGIDEYSQIVNNDTDQIVTSSWAICEQLAQLAEPGTQEAENLLFEQAAAQGQTILSAAGDTGNDECNESRFVAPPAGQNLLSVLDPASQPYVVSVGGTTIDDATQPPLEHVWNDGAEWGAGGGGISESWAMPSWQQLVANTPENSDDVENAEAFETSTASESAPFTTPSFCDGTLGLPSGTPCRETPDVSAQADEFTGAVTIYGQSLGYGNPNGWATIGGTSSATPIWAGLLALVNASQTCSSNKINGVPDVGFASPILYGIAANPTAYSRSFNDIVSGNNDDFGLDNGLVFPARAGFDMASGLGSPQLTTPTGGNALAFYMCDYSGHYAPVTLTGLSPSSGSTAGGYLVTVSGTGFGTAGSPNVASVQVGTAHATDVSVTSNTALTARFPSAAMTTPPGSPRPQDGAGPATVVVTLKKGESSVPSAASEFEYVDKNSTPSQIPSVTSVGPFGGLESAPAPVTIYGSGFTGATKVSFGGVTVPSFTVKTPYEITLIPPAYSTQTSCAALPTTGVYKGVYTGENATNDICQVQVVVTNANGSSAKSTILPPYEGALNYDSMGGLIIPAGYEEEPQPTEFDYVPQPTVTSVSTGTVADLKNCVSPPSAKCNAGLLASEFGGLPANLITVEGTGMNELTLEYALLGLPTINENSVAYPVAATGTSMELIAPSLPTADKPPTLGPFTLPVGFASIAGASNLSNIVYAGVPNVSAVENPVTGLAGVPDSVACTSPPPSSGCGTPIDIGGAGLLQAVGPIGFVDNLTGFSLGTQYNYAVKSDKAITTESVAQNPAVTDVEVCSVTSCSHNPDTDELLVYPPGNPGIDKLAPATGPAQGGNDVVIDGANLGCVAAVYFGNVMTFEVSNTQALLTCGTTNQVVVLAPPGQAGTKVSVRVATVESLLDPAGRLSNSILYTYTPSAPSPPTEVTATTRPGTATVKWVAPAINGGSPVTGYTVSASSPGLPSVGEAVKSTARSLTYADLQAGATWTFSVRAISNKGAGLPGVSNPVTPVLGDDGYLVETPDGAVLGFGDILSHGGIDGEGAEAAGVATIPDGLGYWVVTTTGAVTPFGDTGFFGQASTRNVSGIASLPDGKGYWIVIKSGDVRAFGGAKTYAGKLPKGADVVGIASSFDGNGYWLVSSDGAVTAFGDAHSYGSIAGSKLSAPIVGIAVTPDGKGYWLACANGSVYHFGDAHSYGSIAGSKLSAPVVGIAATPDGKGYWLVSSDGTIHPFGAALNVGNATSAVAMGV